MPLHLNRGMCKLKVGKLDDALWDTVDISTVLRNLPCPALPYCNTLLQYPALLAIPYPALPYPPCPALPYHACSNIPHKQYHTWQHRSNNAPCCIVNDVPEIIPPNQSECNTMRLPCLSKTTVIIYIPIKSYGMATPVLQTQTACIIISCHISHTLHNRYNMHCITKPQQS